MERARKREANREKEGRRKNSEGSKTTHTPDDETLSEGVDTLEDSAVAAGRKGACCGSSAQL